MPGVFQMATFAGLVVLGLLLATQGVAAWLSIHRSLTAGLPRKGRSGQPAELGSKYARFDGKLRALEPRTTVEGARAVAIARGFRFEYETEEGVTQSSPTDITHEFGPVEVTTENGSFVFDLDQPNLIATGSEYELSPAQVQQCFPEWWAELPPTIARTMKRLHLGETAVLDGVQGFVMGEVVPAMDQACPHVLRGSQDRPVVLSGLDGKTARGRLLGGAMGLVWLALLAWVLAGVQLVLPRVLFGG